MKNALFDKQSRRQAKLDAIVETAATLISSKGVGGTSLDDVANVLGVTKPTLYHYVSSKEDLLNQCMERILAEKKAILDAADAHGKSGREKLEYFIRGYAQFCWSDSSGLPGLMFTPEISEAKRIEVSKRNMEFAKRTRAHIREGIKDGSLLVDQPELLENFIVSFIVYTPISFIQRREKIEFEKVLSAYLGFLMDGVGAKRKPARGS
jgi:AcrR family transcriptional regulator